MEDRQGETGVNELDDETWESTYHHSPNVREFHRLNRLDNRQRRGYDFQTFVANLFRRWHFRVTPSPQTARPRQTDLLAVRGEDKYLIEIKWRSSKANINDIESLFSRLEAAPATTIGLMVSFPGFSTSVVNKVEQRSDRPVLLMTGEELERIVERDEDLAHLLARKKNALLTSRRVLFVTSSARHAPLQLGDLTTAPAEFVFLDGMRAKWLTGGGGFGEFTFVQELPDIDWSPGEGRGVMLDMTVPVHDERGIVALLQQLASMGWATTNARWSIQQSETNWHGIGMSTFSEVLQDWQNRYKNISTHHSEEFCYFDICDGGFYCLTANMSAHKVRSASRVMLSFQLSGMPLDTDPFRELTRTFDSGSSYYFRPMERKSVNWKWHLGKEDNVPLEPLAFIVEEEEFFRPKEDWVRGVVAKNPGHVRRDGVLGTTSRSIPI